MACKWQAVFTETGVVPGENGSASTSVHFVFPHLL